MTGQPSRQHLFRRLAKLRKGGAPEIARLAQTHAILAENVIAKARVPAEEIIRRVYGDPTQYWQILLAEPLAARLFARLVAYHTARSANQLDLLIDGNTGLAGALRAGIAAGAIRIVGAVALPPKQRPGSGNALAALNQQNAAFWKRQPARGRSVEGAIEIVYQQQESDDNLIDPKEVVAWLLKTPRWRHLVPASLLQHVEGAGLTGKKASPPDQVMLDQALLEFAEKIGQKLKQSDSEACRLLRDLGATTRQRTRAFRSLPLKYQYKPGEPQKPSAK